jgi:gamma-tubulin complex component 3
MPSQFTAIHSDAQTADPTPKKVALDQERQFDVNSPAFNQAFSNAGLLRLPNAEDPSAAAKQDRQIPRSRRDKAKAEPGASGDAEAAASPEPTSYVSYDILEPSEPTLLRDLPFTLQGYSSTNFTFVSNKVLKLPNTLPVPVVSILHTLAEPSLLYKQIHDYVQETDGGLLGQSFRSALDVELRAYLQFVAQLEAQIRRALAQLNDDEPRQGIGKAGVTLRRCVLWSRDSTTALRLLNLMVEQTKDKKGGQLISMIHSFSQNHGDPFVCQVAERLLSHVTRPFYEMLRQWIYDGELSDPHGEFFVIEQQEKADDSDNGARRGAASSVWEDKYKLESVMVPTILTDTFANKVFLIGKSLNFIRHGCNDANWVQSYSRDASRELKYGDTATLETSIDEAYKTTMARLIHLMATKFHLWDHLGALKNYLLLGAGDFISVLMESLASNLEKPANTQYRHTLTAQLEHAVRNSNAQYDSPEVLRRLDSRMLELSHGEIGWDVFTLEYKISAPIDVIVTPYGSKQYLKVFNFLWRVKRVEFALNSTWRRCMTGARTALRNVDDLVGRDWKTARCVVAEMVHFISQLQYYILFEVIERSWHDLKQAMNKPESTLDDLIQAHAEYLNSITTKGLLGSGSIDFTRQLHELLKTMLSYKDAVDGLYGVSVAENLKRQNMSAKIETRTAAGKWGLSERDRNPSEDSAAPTPALQRLGKGMESSPLLPLLGGLSQGVNEEDVLVSLRKRLKDLAGEFKARVNVLLGDLYHQPDAGMRWLAMVMNFNDVYQPVRRRKRVAGARDKDKEKTVEKGKAKATS